jgi:glycosyltransferase involved in cell wall biosynthesis
MRLLSSMMEAEMEPKNIIRTYIDNPEYHITYRYQENGWVGKARNHGLSLMNEKSDYLIFLDSDDELVPDLISSCLSKWNDLKKTWDYDKVLGYYFLCEDEYGNILGGKENTRRKEWEDPLNMKTISLELSI